MEADRARPTALPMIYERIAWRYMEIVNPTMFAEFMSGIGRGSVSRMKCLDYLKNHGWVRD